MSEPLDVDPNALRASLPELQRLADEAASVLSELTGTVDREGACWGSDASGKAFAKNYLPDVEQGIRNLAGLVSGMRTLGSEVSNVANAFDNQDSDIAARLQGSGAAAAVDTAPDGSASTPNGPVGASNALSDTLNGAPLAYSAGWSELPPLLHPPSQQLAGSGRASVPPRSSAAISPETAFRPGTMSPSRAVTGPDARTPVPSDGAAASADSPGVLDAGRSGDSRPTDPAEVDAKTGYSSAD